MLPLPALAPVARAHSGGHVLRTDSRDVQHDCAVTLDLKVLIFSVDIVAPSATAAFCKTPSSI
jgi:hypothetical protein